MIFGAGNLYEEKENYIRDNFEIIAFLDNKVGDSALKYKDTNIPIYSPARVKDILQPDVWIILMSYQYISMWEQLYELGVNGERILFGIMFPPYTESFEALFSQGGHLAIDGNHIKFSSDSGVAVVIKNHTQIREMAEMLLREQYKRKYPLISMISQMEARPVSRKFGMERGKAIDRYYIEKFLKENEELVYGDCLEIAENTYTLRYGGERVKNSYVLHLKGWGKNAFKGNLETGEGICEEKYDCAIITQTLMFIYDIRQAAVNIFKMLKPGGCALVTVSGISQISRYDADLWGSYYSFHEGAIRALFEPIFGKDNIEVFVYGNAKIAMAMLYGLCVEDLREEDFLITDNDYPVILGAILKKNHVKNT